MDAHLTPIVVHNSDVRTLTSRSIDQEYRIPVSLPMDYVDRGEKCPVLYVLDPGLLIGCVTDIARTAKSIGQLFGPEVPSILVVGIDYPSETLDQPELRMKLRQRDMTPTKSLDDIEMEAWSGGAENFLGFIKKELMPYINSNYGTDPEDTTIIGGSLGGLFALYVLFNKPDTFRRYVALSPSLWWDNKVTFKHERDYALNHEELSAKLFLSTGTCEGGEEDGPVVLANFKELVTILDQRNYKGLEWESSIYEGEGHMCAAYSGLCKGILSVFSIKI
jgi:uncharacterized protein